MKIKQSTQNLSQQQMGNNQNQEKKTEEHNNIVKFYLVNKTVKEFVYIEISSKIDFNLKVLLDFTGWNINDTIEYEDIDMLFGSLVYNNDLEDGYITGKKIEGIYKEMYPDFDQYKIIFPFYYFTNNEKKLVDMHLKLYSNFLKDDKSWIKIFEKMQ